MFAHALIRHVPATPLLAVLAVMLVAAVVARAPSPQRRREEVPGDEAQLTSWAGRLSPGQVAGRALAIGLVALAVLAGRIGSENQLRNIAPALVVGAGWPFLVLASTVIGGVWRWLDPWDGLARALGQRDRDPREGPGAYLGVEVWPAVVPAMAWAWYLSAFRHALSPRAVGTAVAGYSIVTVAGCLAFGRRQWLPRVEVFGLLFGWLARLPHRRLVSWIVPAGGEAVLGVLAGGLLFGAVRRSSLWGTLNVVPLADLYAAAGVVGASAAMAGLFVVLGRWSGRLGAPGSVAAAVVPALASVIVAVAMVRSLLSTSVQFLPILASDPFGRGWNLFGTADWAVPEPLGDGVRALAQAIVLVAGHFAGALVLTRRVSRSGRLPAALALCALLVSAAVALSLR
ncbi:MAG: hypothetical protein ACRDHO_03080 [Actinomycetota bacterium]